MEKPAMTAAEAARQLRRPDGEAGVQIGLQMNKSNRLLYEMALDFLGLQPGDHILEIGMGNGFFIPQLFEQEPSIHYTGLDLSDCMVAAATRENEALIAAGRVTIVEGRAEAIPVATGSLQKVFGANVLYFWDEPHITLQEIRRVLQPGGELVLAIRSKQTMEQLPFVDHGFTLYDVASATALLEQQGFTVTESKTAIEPQKLAADGSKLVQLENICIRAVKN